MNWFVLSVKSRSEKKVAERLEKCGVTIFFPTKIEEKAWSDRIKKVEVPYFTSYIFAKFPENEATSILETPGVVRRLFWLGKPAVVRAEEMEEVIQFFDTHKHKPIECLTFKPGEEVEINSGKLKDRKAVVIKYDQKKVILSLPGLGCTFKVLLEKNKLRKFC